MLSQRHRRGGKEVCENVRRSPQNGGPHHSAKLDSVERNPLARYDVRFAICGCIIDWRLKTIALFRTS